MVARMPSARACSASAGRRKPEASATIAEGRRLITARATSIPDIAGML